MIHVHILLVQTSSNFVQMFWLTPIIISSRVLVKKNYGDHRCDETFCILNKKPNPTPVVGLLRVLLIRSVAHYAAYSVVLKRNMTGGVFLDEKNVCYL